MKTNIYNFDKVVESGRKYGGMAGAKLGIIFENEKWILKFPKSTKGNNKIEISYTTMPISEYLGSHIYEAIGIDTQKTILGIKDGKVVVACKDFKDKNEEFYEFREIKNDYVKGLEEKLESISSTTTGKGIDINEIILIMENNPTFINNPDLIKRFWDMFVVDSLIGNNDRNNGNWGILVNDDTRHVRIAPVYDNGAAFNNRIGEDRIKEILNNQVRFKNSAYESNSSAFFENDKNINPLKYIETAKNKDLNDAIKRIVPQINIEKMNKIIDSVPDMYGGINIISDMKKELYKKIIKYRYENVLLPTYNKISNNA